MRTKWLWVIATLIILMVSGCGLLEKGYSEQFEKDGVWKVDASPNLKVRVENERLLYQLDLPRTMHWSVAGRRNFGDGVFEVDGGVVAGSAEAGYGIVFRADPSAKEFFFFLVSGDGKYAVGACQSACVDDKLIFLPNAKWVDSSAIKTGIDASNHLAVTIQGKELQFSVNGEELLKTKYELPEKGDIGLVVQTFDAGATIAFDNLTFSESK